MGKAKNASPIRTASTTAARCGNQTANRGLWEVSRPLPNHKLTLCYRRRLWLIFLERARKLSYSVSRANPIRAFAGNLYKVRQVELSFHHRRGLSGHS
jgi:hypothetical protein